MGKALMVGPVGSSIASGNEANLFGSGSHATESFTQYSATEGASFTGLGGRVTSGNSAAATTQFRDAGVNGQNVISIAGIGAAEDTTHTDTLTAGDLFNLAMTDTGTNPVYAWVKANVEFASGHGCFHGAASYAGIVCDVASSTRYFAINGNISADGSAAIANVQWKNRGYTSLEAFQVNVSANLRTNNSVFSVNINGVDVGTAITYAAATAGLQSVIGMGISLADGDLICISITLGTGVEDLTLMQVGVTLKSTANASEVVCGFQGGLTRFASATANYYTPGGQIVSAASEADQRIKPGFATRCKNLRCYLSANTYTVNATLKLMVNGVAQITTTLTASGGAGWYENTTDTYDINATDEVSYEIVGGTSGLIGIGSIGMTFGEIPAVTVAPEPPNPTMLGGGHWREAEIEALKAERRNRQREIEIRERKTQELQAKLERAREHDAEVKAVRLAKQLQNEARDIAAAIRAMKALDDRLNMLTMMTDSLMDHRRRLLLVALAAN